MSARSTDVMLLLGAGASVDAGIPASATMIKDLESLLHNGGEWGEHLQLYRHVKSAIHYAAGLKGVYGWDVPFNIETLVNTLYELERNEEHPLYPFIGSWNSRFVALAGSKFEHIRRFRSLILKQLKRWMCPDSPSRGDYYKGLVNLQRELNYPLRIFTLNYDRCVERIERDGFRVEAGFGGNGADHFWDWERFEQHDADSSTPPQAYLYKIHGSMDWKRDQDNNLFRVEQTESVEHERMEIIFGRDFKLEAADPYLFYAYEFRRYCLLAKLIVVIGYSFSDGHINKMLVQALRNDKDCQLFVVIRCEFKKEIDSKREEIAEKLDVSVDRIGAYHGSARDFLSSSELGNCVRSRVPEPSDGPF
ncbi:SIR2 family protein [Fimbriiglobus ruber]|nr:SIR2 family protein [Fimbriiglobus ruber]